MKTIEQKRTEAQKRQAEYDTLSIEEKLSRLPEGGSARQRAKLHKQQTTEKIERVITQKVVEDKAKEERKNLKAKERRAKDKKRAA